MRGNQRAKGITYQRVGKQAQKISQTTLSGKVLQSYDLGKLYEYLADIEEQVEKLFEEIVKSLTEKEDVTKKLKANNPMLWVQKMNNIRNRVTEIVNTEVIYR